MPAVTDRKVPSRWTASHVWTMGSVPSDLGLRWRRCLGGHRFSLLPLSCDLLEYPCDVLLTLQNDDTKRYSQADTPSCENNKRLNVSIPPLDALIIPKVVCDCKTITIFSQISPTRHIRSRLRLFY